MFRMRVALALALSMCWLTACGSPARPALPPSTTVHLPPLSMEIVIVPGCKLEVLESWYEVSTALHEMYRTESLAALDLPPDEQMPALVHLADVRRRLVQQPVPECAATAHGVALAYIEQVANAFEAYSNGSLGREALRREVTAAMEGLHRKNASLMAVAEARLARALEERRATLEADGAP